MLIQAPPLVLESSAPDATAAILELLESGEATLFMGSELSVEAGFPRFEQVLLDLTNESDPGGQQDSWAVVRQALQQGEIETATELVTNRLHRDAVIARFKEVYSRRRMATRTLIALRNLRFSNVVTTTWDHLVSDAFASSAPIELSPYSTENIEALFQGQRFCIVRLGGLLEENRILLSFEEYRRQISLNTLFSKALVSLSLSRSHFFVGVGAETIYRYFTSLPNSSEGSRRHLAVVPRDKSFAIHAERLGRFGVQIIALPGREPYKELRTVAESVLLTGRRQGRGNTVVATTDAGRFKSLSSVELTNIGPFTSLRIPLAPDVNVLLGNNGCGKSTILKAIALALCGDQAQSALVDRLLRVGDAMKGFVRITFGLDSYQIDLDRTTAGTWATSSQVSPLLQSSIFVIGFPAIRGLATGDPAGPTGAALGRPTADDVLPLLAGTVDQRIANIKQWLVNIEASVEVRSDVTEQQARRARKLLDTFFAVLGDFLEGLNVSFDRVDKLASSWKVLVKTDDGIVSIDQLSQGMNSTIALVGTILQRMFEVYPDSENPDLEGATVLIDELDAHLHPRWQQNLLGLLRKRFPNVQLIVTTHSPLIVAGVATEKIIRLQRQPDGIVEVTTVEGDEARGRADQILTGPLFGLKTTLDAESQALLAEYMALIEKRPSELSEEQQSRLDMLRSTLRTSLVPPEEGPATRRASQLLGMLLRSHVGDSEPAYQAQLLTSASALLEEVHRAGGQRA